jgi:hypothetical protein
MLLRPIDSRSQLRILAAALVVFGLAWSQSAAAFSFDHDPPATGTHIQAHFSSNSDHSGPSVLGAQLGDFHSFAATHHHKRSHIFNVSSVPTHYSDGTGHSGCGAVVPEPATAALLLLGLGGLPLAARARRE